MSIWAGLNALVTAGEPHTLSGIAFNPFGPDDGPFAGRYPETHQIKQDIELLEGKTDALRTYGSANGLEQVPRLAQEEGLQVAAGAWLDKDLAGNEVEIRNLLANAREYDSVTSLIVGNEAVLRGDLTTAQLRGYLQRVQRQTDVSVSTAEPWHVWIQHPELAEAVDFITIHVLPYWEGVPVDYAMTFIVEKYHQVQEAYPDQEVVLGEVGWPSAGEAFETAEPSPHNQATFFEEFLAAVETEGFGQYFALEAFDQPWKAQEGSVGPHWGLFDAQRQPKLSLFDSTELPGQIPTAFSSILGAGVALWAVRRAREVRWHGRLLFSAGLQAGASAVVYTIALVAGFSAPWTTRFLLWWLVPVQGLMLLIAAANGFELVEVLCRSRWQRRFMPAPEAIRYPKVSIHVPASKEPPEVVNQSLDALSSLDYPNFEVVVICNSTPDPRLWSPVREHCLRLGERFRFVYVPHCHGYKAGALNMALSHTDPGADIVAVIDSDYVVRPNWLQRLVPYFQDPSVGFVQTPQDYRDGGEPYKETCKREYETFFRTGMVQRNERNAIILHGTMAAVTGVHSSSPAGVG